ncbi:MAG: SpoIIE family protein phosphatase [Pseudobacteriovorax sp.]|nr:SpoIIE family protein phosphatase [Pseudobacteriovorax sp.]
MKAVMGHIQRLLMTCLIVLSSSASGLTIISSESFREQANSFLIPLSEEQKTQLIEQGPHTLDFDHLSQVPDSQSPPRKNLRMKKEPSSMFLHVKNPKQQSLFLEMTNGILLNMIVYQWDGNSWLSSAIKHEKNFGLYSTISPIPHIELGQRDDAYILITTNSMIALASDVIISNQRGFNQRNSYLLVIGMLYFGVVFGLAFYNLFLFIMTRERTYLFYSTYVLAHSVYMATEWGYIYLFLDTPIMPTRWASLAVSFVATLFFLNEIIGLKAYPRALKWLIASLGLHISVSFAMHFAPYMTPDWIQLVYSLTLLTAISCMFYIMISARLKGNYAAQYLLISHTLLVLTIVYASSNLNRGDLPFVQEGLMLGFASEAILMAFALAYKLKVYQKEKHEAQKISNQRLQKNHQLNLDLVLQETDADKIISAMAAIEGELANLSPNYYMAYKASPSSDILHERGKQKDFLTTEAIVVGFESQIFGCLIIGHQITDWSYVLPFVKNVASSLGTHLNHGITREALRKKETQDRALQASQIIQESFLPAKAEIPSCIRLDSIYQAADETGGDWFYVFSLNEDRYVLCLVADVVGHGVSSALVTGVIYGVIESYLKPYMTHAKSVDSQVILDQLFMSLNRIIHQLSAKSGLKVAMLGLLLDAKTGAVEYRNAAHRGFYYSQGDQVKGLLVPGSWMGSSEDSFALGRESFRLSKGDRVFLFTDGLTENTNSEGKTLREASLVKKFSQMTRLSEFFQYLHTTISEHWDDQPEDDTTVVVFEYCCDPEQQASDKVS